MEYGKTVEEKVYKKYITHGINDDVFISAIEKVSGEKNGTVWNGFDITFSNGEGELKSRIFEFKYNGDYTNWKGVVIDQKAQEDEYLKRLKHIFSKAIGDPNEYDKLVSKVTGKTDSEKFDSLITLLQSVVGKSKKFRLLCIDNKKGYPTIPSWSNGFVESMDVNPSKLKYDEGKYGKKTEPNNVEVITKAKDDLPF